MILKLFQKISEIILSTLPSKTFATDLFQFCHDSENFLN